MENQTTAPEVQSEQPKEVAQEQVAEQQTEAKPTVLADATTEQKAEQPKVLNFKEMIPEEYKDEKSLQNFILFVTMHFIHFTSRYIIALKINTTEVIKGHERPKS